MVTTYTQQQAREAAAAEAARRAANAAATRAQEQQVSSANLLSQQRQQQQYQDQIKSGASEEEANRYVSGLDLPSFTRTGSATGGTQIVSRQGYNQDTGYYENNTVVGGSLQANRDQSYTPSDASMAAGKFQTYDAVTGKTTAAPELGNIDQSALKRLMDSGMTEGQARAQITSLRPSIQQTMGSTGQNQAIDVLGRLGLQVTGTIDGRASLNVSEENLRKLEAAGLVAGVGGVRPDGNYTVSLNVGDRELQEQYTKRKQEADTTNANLRERQRMQQEKDAAIKSARDMERSGANNFTDTLESTERVNPVSENNKSQFQQLQAVLNSNPVFAGSDYGRLIAAQLNTQYSVDADEIFLQQMLDFQSEDKDFSGATDAVEDAAAESKRLLTERTEKQDAINQRHLDIAKETAEISKSMQEFEKQKFEINQKIREQEQAEANIENEQRNRRIANKMGIETDTSGLKFMRDEVRKGKEALQRLSEFGDAQRGQFALQIGRQYSLDINNALLRYDEQQLIIDSNFANSLKDIDNTVSMDAKERRERKDGMWKDYWNMKMTQDKETAETVRTVGKEMMSAINQQKNDERVQSELGWDRMDWASKTYGSGAPQAIIDSIQKMLPNVDVAGTLTSMTLAEMKQKKVGSGGGNGLSFPSYDRKAGGGLPSYDEFVDKKTAEVKAMLKQDTTLGIAEAQVKMKQLLDPAVLKAEFDARTSSTNQYNPTEIINRFKMKAGTLSSTSRKYAEAQLQEALNSGDYKFASDLVDNTGDDVPSTQANDFTQALNSRYNVKKMQSLFDDIGLTYPGVGLVRKLNPLDSKVIQYKQNLTQTIPGLARGIFKEVGVLTDSDIERYTSSMANPNLTQEQARTAFNDLVQRVDVSMQNQINVWDANRKAVKGFRDLYNAEPIGEMADDATSTYLNSLPR